MGGCLFVENTTSTVATDHTSWMWRI